MSVLFCHDHRFIVDPSGAVYSRGQFSKAIVGRYERVFGDMSIAARTMPVPEPFDPARYNLVFEDPSRFIELPSLSNPRSLLLGNAQAQRRLEEAVASTNAVIARLPSEIGLLASAIARRKDTPLGTEVVGSVRDSLMEHGHPAARIYAPLADWRMRREVARSEWTVYTTADFLQSRYPSRGDSTGASNVQLPPPDEAVLSQRLGRITNSRPPITCAMIAAMFHDEKRVDIAIRALAEAVRSDADIRLQVVGPGDTSTLAAFAASLGVGDRVRFLGVVPHGAALFAFLDGADIFLQTSFGEGLSRALVEAMSRAMPALASDVGGTRELLNEQWLHSPGDASTLARQMLHVRDEKLRARLAEENFVRAGEFAPAKLDARRAAFWRTFCSAHGIEPADGGPV